MSKFAALVGAAVLVLAMPQPAAAQPSIGGAEPQAAPAGFEAESDTGNWIVRFEDPALAGYAGDIAGLPATSPAVTGAGQLDAGAPASVAYLSYLDGVQDQFVGSMEDTLDRSVDVPFRYQNVLNGMAVTVSAAEAARLAELPGVVSVTPDTERELETDTSHSLIGSPSFWDGETGPDLATRGEGVVVAMLDTGVNAPHPSFAAVSPGDGFVHQNPFGSGTFVGACDPANPNHQAVCNDKLIGAYNFHTTGPNFPSVLDWNDHGSHVGSTIAGNLHDATFTFGQTDFTRTVQGVAPRANVISYLICDPQCPSTSAIAAVNQAIVDGVDVLNYSISGVDNPWVDPVDLAFLDAFEAGIYVAASAGNNGPDTIAKTGPWNASVAASTHERVFAHGVDVTSAGAPPELTGMPGVTGTGPQVAADIEAEVRFVESNRDGCVPFAAGTFDGAIALIERGACNFVVKVDNATAAGAIAVVLTSNLGGPPVAAGALETTTIPTVMLDRTTGGALREFVVSNPDPTQARINVATAGFTDPAWEDVMASFSSTGPSQFEMLAPTFTAPGVNILAAARGGEAAQYTLLQGTSMSSPHGAGSGALLAALHPDWTPAQVRSALASTADPEGVRAPDGDTPATQFNLGSGRLDLTAAARVGVTMDETTANFVAANPTLGGDPKTLNLPAFIDHGCATCSWERTVTSVADAPASYTAQVDAPTGMAVTVTPSEFTIAPGASQDIQVSVDASTLPDGEWAFADVRLVTTGSHAGGLPVASVHYPIGVVAEVVQQAPEITVDPAEITAVQGADQTVTHELTIGNVGDANLDWSVFENQPTGLPADGGSPVAAGPAPEAPVDGASLSTRQTLLRGVFGPPVPQVVTPEATPAQEGEITITHSQSQAIVAENSVACSPDDGVTTTENGYLRQFTLADFGVTGDLEVTEVSFGVEVLRSAAQDLAVNLFTMIDPDGPFTYPNFSPIGSATVSVPPQEMSMVTVPVTGTATAGSTLVVEVDAPDVSGTGAFFIGSNPNGQTAPSYIRSVSCQIPQPTDLALIDVPNMHVVLNVHGNADVAEPDCQVPSGTPWVDLDQVSGTVAPFGEQTVEVTFDSTGLADGDELTANLCLASNDPANPLVVVPLTLQVEDAATPVIEVTPESLSAELVEGDSADQALTVGNVGDGPLDWDIFADEPDRLPTGSTPVQPADVPPTTTLVGFGTSPDGVPGSVARSETEPLQEGEVTITHSTSQDILVENSLACSVDEGATTTDHGYLRHFVLEDFDMTSEFAVTSVSFGVENINGPPHPVTVNLFRMIDPAGPFVYDNLELVGTAAQDLPAQQLQVVDMPVSGTAPAGSTLVVEIDTPDMSGIGSFFVGSNDSGETAPSFIRSATCGITEPSNLTELGFPGMHIMMSVTGITDVEVPVCGAPGDVPWLSVSPESGSTAPGQSSEVAVSFDSAGLAPGEYQALLCVNSNDPATPLVQVPVSLTVVEDPGGTVCDETIFGVHDGPLTVSEGTTCLAAGSQVLGEVNVSAGAGLIATAAVIQGPLSAVGASVVDLAFTQVTGPVLVFGTTGRVSLFASQVTGSVSLLNGLTGDPTAVSGNTVIGTLSCFGNQPPPTDHGLSNTATGGKLGQCADL